MSKNNNITLVSVILYYNTLEKTRKCLRACINSKNIDQYIVLVDNNSKENPLEKLLSNFEIPQNLIIIRNKSNLGFSAGINIGIRYALRNLKPKYISIVNSDLYLEKNALFNSIKRLDYFEGNLPIGALTAKIYMEDKKHIWQAGGHIDLLTMSGVPYGLLEKDSKKFSNPGFVGWASGAFSVFPSKVLRKVGLFSEDFFFGQEEWDLSLRLLKHNYLIYYDPDVIASHSVGGSYRSSHPVLNTFNGYCNKVIMARKHFSTRKYFIWLLIFETRTFLISLVIALKHSFCPKDFFLQLKAIYLALLISPFIERTNNKLLKKISRIIGTSKTWPNYWGVNKLKKGTIVVHSGKRDNYQVARSLQNDKSLKYLVTDFYVKDNLFFKKFIQFLAIFFPKLKTRIHKELPSEKVIVSKSALLFSIISRALKKIHIDNHFEEIHDFSLAKKANKLALKYDCHIISYSTYATRSFKNIENKKILFQMHPYVDYVRETLQKEFIRNPLCKSSIKEYEFRIFKSTLENLKKEPFLSDFIICPSTFCSKTLPKFSKGKKVIIPYGSRLKSNQIKNKKFKQFRVLFIGSLGQRKGILYLLKIAEKLINENIQFTIITRSIDDEYLYNKAKEISNVEILLDINNLELKNTLQNSHIFILPSLIEGFAHVVLEAMSFGLIPITSPFCCGPDLIKINENGYIFQPYEIDKISAKIFELFKDQDLFKKISKASYETSLKYTETNFMEELNKFFSKNINI